MAGRWWDDVQWTHTLHREDCPRIGTPLQDATTWGSS